MPAKSLQDALVRGRAGGPREVVFFVNGGDPTPPVTFELLRVLRDHGCAAVELCVPFPRSFTDGPVVRASHERALAGGATFESVLLLAERASSELGLHVVLLADYAHTVAPRGMDRFLRATRDAGASATLVHGLPRAERAEYVTRSATLGLGRIMTFFIGSDAATRHAAYVETQGFTYVVSRFGRTGGAGVGLGPDVIAQLRALRVETTKPLAVGFGVKGPHDVARLHDAGADAVIVGSAAVAVVARHLDEPERLIEAFRGFVGGLLVGGLPTDATRACAP